MNGLSTNKSIICWIFFLPVIWPSSRVKFDLVEDAFESAGNSHDPRSYMTYSVHGVYDNVYFFKWVIYNFQDELQWISHMFC